MRVSYRFLLLSFKIRVVVCLSVNQRVGDIKRLEESGNINDTELFGRPIVSHDVAVPWPHKRLASTLPQKV